MISIADKESQSQDVFFVNIKENCPSLILFSSGVAKTIPIIADLEQIG